jgi:hypothetical protein
MSNFAKVPNRTFRPSVIVPTRTRSPHKHNSKNNRAYMILPLQYPHVLLHTKLKAYAYNSTVYQILISLLWARFAI